MLPPVHTQGYHTRGETIKDITVSKWQSPSDRVRVKSVSPCDSSRVWVRLTGGVSWSAFDWATPKPHVSHPLLSPLTLGNFHADHEQSLSTMSSKDKILGLLPVTTNHLPHPLLNHPHHRPDPDQISIKLDRKWSGGSPGSGSQTQGLRLSCESFHFQPLARKPSSYFFSHLWHHPYSLKMFLSSPSLPMPPGQCTKSIVQIGLYLNLESSFRVTSRSSEAVDKPFIPCEQGGNHLDQGTICWSLV